MSWIILGMPGITCSRVSTCAPDCINSATVRPSRAPSRMKLEMIAIASGWLILTPRSSRRRATMAAIEIRSLSFSRGDRFMKNLFRSTRQFSRSIQPQPRQRGTCARQHGHHVGAQTRRILGTEPRHCKAIPGRDSDLACEGVRRLADLFDQGFVTGSDEGVADRRAALRHRRSRELGSDVAVEPNGLGKNQPAAPAQPPTVD